MNEFHTTLELRLFGEIEVKIDGESVTGNLSAKGRLLLGYLALHAGQAVSTGRIADTVFSDSLALDPHEVIKKTVQRVRRALGEHGARLSAPGPRMLALRTVGAQVDWELFHHALRRGDPESLQHAVALHSHPFLEEEPLPWALEQRTTCLNLRQKALETLFQQAMERADLEQAGHRLSQMLMFALPEVTINEALWRTYFGSLIERKVYGPIHLHYARLETFLERAEGRVPEAQTQALLASLPKSVLLRKEQRKKKNTKETFSAEARLPSVPFALIGRETEKRALIDLFQKARLVTIVGPGGVGKTRFAIQAGYEMRADDRQAVGFVDLTSCPSNSVLQMFANAVGVRERAPDLLFRSLQEFLCDKPFLLILDNCEHRIEEVAALASALVRGCPDLRLLLTSREMLRVESEQVFLLSPLALPEERTMPGQWTDATLVLLQKVPAVRLFLERACAVRPDFWWNVASAVSVVRLCRLVDGLPLGIEIVASQVMGLPLERIVEDLADCMLKLPHRKRGVLPRHQTLQTTLEYSYGLLESAEQALLRRLSVFAGGWTLEAAEEICADASLPQHEIASLLSGLVSKSLVVLRPDVGKSLSFSLLETIRLFCLEKLQESGEEVSLHAGHCVYFRDLILKIDDLSRIEGAVSQIRRLMPNFHAAIRWGTADPDSLEPAATLCITLGAYWIQGGYVTEGLGLVDAILQQEVPSLSPKQQVQLLLLRARLASRTLPGDELEIRPYLERALEGLPSLQDRVLECEAYLQVAVFHTDPAESRGFYRKALAGFREAERQDNIAYTLLLCGNCSHKMGEGTVAEAECQEGLQIAAAGGFSSLQALAFMFLGTFAKNRSDLTRAEYLYAQSLTFYQNLGSGWAIRTLKLLQSEVKRLQKDWGQSSALLMETLLLSLEADDPSEAAIFDSAQFCTYGAEWEKAYSLYTDLCHVADPLNDRFQEYQQARTAAEQYLTAAQRQNVLLTTRARNHRDLVEDALEILESLSPITFS